MSAPTDAHEWVSFEDAEEERTWLVDITYLLSRWNCIFNNGCKGVLDEDATELVQGCCSYGAHFSDADDLARVESVVPTLLDSEWQFKAEGLSEGYLDREGDQVKTALVDDACIFLNRPDFDGARGCAFHIAARRLGVAHLELQPEVCWQVPVRREDLVDDQGRVTSTITQWDRRHWGPAGEDFHWWCIDAPEAYTAAVPVYQSLEPELTRLMGKKNFAQVKRYLDARLADGTPLPHPTVRKKSRKS